MTEPAEALQAMPVLARSKTVVGGLWRGVHGALPESIRRQGPDAARRARITLVACLLTTLLGSVAGWQHTLSGNVIVGITGWAVVFAGIAIVAAMYLSGSWRVQAALLCLTIFAACAFVTAGTGAALVASSVYLAFVPLLATFVLGVRWGIVAALASAGTLVLVEVARQQGAAFPFEIPPELAARSNFRGSLLFMLVVLVIAIVYDALRQASLRDVTESAARYQALGDRSSDLLFELDQAGRVRFVSRRHSDALGSLPNGFLGQPFVGHVHPEDAGQFERDLRLALATGARRGDAIRLRGSDGSWTWFEPSTTAYETPDGDWRLIVVARDMTERLRVEERLRQSQKMDAIGQLAGGVAHDFNNVLMVIAGCAEELASHGPRGDDDREAIDEIRQAAAQGSALTQQLLAVGRPTSTEGRVISLNQIVSDMRHMLSRLIGDDVLLQLDLEPDLPPVFVDPGHVEQILVNLFVNARDAMPNGGTLRVRTASDGDRVTLDVADSGVGLDHDTRERMFEAFFTTKPPGRGTGLGLAIVYALVRGMSGEIRVDSSPGHGTTFTIDLPCTREVPGESPRVVKPRQTLAGGRETILLVEDRAAVLRVVTRALRSAGYTVLEAGDGAAALRIARSHAGAIHLVLTDVVMPSMSGPEMARQLQPLLPRARFLFMSGHPERAGILAREIDERALIMKPILPSELCQRVRAALDSDTPFPEFT